MNEKILVSVNNETICNFKFQDAKKLPGKIEFAMTFDNIKLLKVALYC